MIRLESVSKHHSSPSGPIRALEEVTLHIKTGEIFGIIGKSGAGKSTLLRCINGLETPTQGKVFLNQADLNDLDVKQRNLARQKLGMIFQNFNLLRHRTVAGNIALPLELQGYNKHDINKRVNELLDLVHLCDKKLSYPSALSGGQKQRVAIARALATKPRALLCDEATSALDPQTTIVILDLLKQLHTQLKLTVVMITHKLSAVKRICDRVAVLDKGHIVEIGDTLAVFTRPQHIATHDLIASKRHLPHSITERMVAEDDPRATPLLLLTFLGMNHAKPIVALLIQRFQLDLSILQADIESIHGQSVGTMLVEVPCNNNKLQQVIQELEIQHVQVEVVGHVHQSTE